MYFGYVVLVDDLFMNCVEFFSLILFMWFGLCFVGKGVF